MGSSYMAVCLQNSFNIFSVEERFSWNVTHSLNEGRVWARQGRVWGRRVRREEFPGRATHLEVLLLYFVTLIKKFMSPVTELQYAFVSHSLTKPSNPWKEYLG